MDDILRRAQSLGIKFNNRTTRLAELQELLYDATRERAMLEEEGENTLLQDIVIEKIREEIAIEAEKSDDEACL